MLKTFNVTEKYEEILPFLESKKNQSSYLCELIQKEMYNERVQVSVEKLHEDFLKVAQGVIKEELQLELRDELRPEIKADIKAEIRSELRGEFRDFKQQIIKDIIQEVKSELKKCLPTIKTNGGSDGRSIPSEQTPFMNETTNIRSMTLSNFADPFQ